MLEEQVVSELDALLSQSVNSRVVRDGVQIAVVGKPNVGKSSLVNRMLQKDRVIVTDVPGTTRDAIEEDVTIEGWAAVLTDTAGLHESSDPVETIGIAKTEEYIETADIILFLVEAGSDLTEEDATIYEGLREKKTILVVNKIDLITERSPMRFPPEWGRLETVRVSALYNKGIDRLNRLVGKACEMAFSLDGASRIVPNLRQSQALKAAKKAAETGIEGIRSGRPVALVAIDLQDGINALDEILGLSAKEDVLARIFSQFCIGK